MGYRYSNLLYMMASIPNWVIVLTARLIIDKTSLDGGLMSIVYYSNRLAVQLFNFVFESISMDTFCVSMASGVISPLTDGQGCCSPENVFLIEF